MFIWFWIEMIGGVLWITNIVSKEASFDKQNIIAEAYDIKSLTEFSGNKSQIIELIYSVSKGFLYINSLLISERNSLKTKIKQQGNL